MEEKKQEDFDSVDEILDFAIDKEQEAYDFYMEWSEKTKEPGISRLFRQFAGEESRHKSKLQNVKQGESVEILEQAASQNVMNLRISDYLVEVSPKPELDYQEALIIAMNREKASFRLYNDLASSTDDKELEKVFLGLAEEEAKHKLRLEVEYDENVLTEN